MNAFSLSKKIGRGCVAGILGLSAAALITGCATGTKTANGPGYIFYPPAPAVPRLQFLVSYSDELDLGAQVSKLASFITGAKPSSQPIVKPYGLALVNKQLYVCDSVAGAVEILDFEKKSLRVFSPGGMAMLKTPINIAVDTDGTRYIADTGRGMAPEEQAHIFKPYYRVEDERDPNDGMGIGLTLCKMLVTLHGGDIWFKSEKGLGSTFYFTLPLATKME